MATPNDSAPAPALCPKCKAPMTTTPAGDETIERCPTCKGMWFDSMTLDRIAKNRKLADTLDPAPSANAPKAAAVLLCPRDHSHLIKMAALGQPHIKYESCKVCGGAFLDAGELHDLAHVSLFEKLRQIFG